MAKQNPDWFDAALALMARGKQKLPVEAAERGRAEQKRRYFIFLAVFFVVLVGALTAALSSLDQSFSAATYLFICAGLPAIVTGLMAVLFYFLLLRGYVDDGNHPWRFRADAQGLSVINAKGEKLESPWRDWRFGGYTYVTIKYQRLVQTIDLQLGERGARLELRRIARPGQLVRATLQQLAAAGAPGKLTP